VSQESEEQDVSLETFIAEMRKCVADFEAHWLAHRAKEPDLWPMQMWRGDWFEQFIAFDQMVEER
jgi:hypothetical protein